MRGSWAGKGTSVDTAGATVLLALRSLYLFFGLTVGSLRSQSPSMDQNYIHTEEDEGIDLRLLLSVILCLLMRLTLSWSRYMWFEVELIEHRF